MQAAGRLVWGNLFSALQLLLLLLGVWGARGFGMGMGWWWVMKCLKKKKKKKGGEGGAGGRAVGKARRMCHRAGKVQGYRLEHCSRIREWRSQAKLCREPTMCVREGERQRVRAGGGARAGEGRVGVGRGGSRERPG